MSLLGFVCVQIRLLLLDPVPASSTSSGSLDSAPPRDMLNSAAWSSPECQSDWAALVSESHDAYATYFSDRGRSSDNTHPEPSSHTRVPPILHVRGVFAGVATDTPWDVTQPPETHQSSQVHADVHQRCSAARGVKVERRASTSSNPSAVGGTVHSNPDEQSLELGERVGSSGNVGKDILSRSQAWLGTSKRKFEQSPNEDRSSEPPDGVTGSRSIATPLSLADPKLLLVAIQQQLTILENTARTLRHQAVIHTSRSEEGALSSRYGFAWDARSSIDAHNVNTTRANSQLQSGVHATLDGARSYAVPAQLDA